MKKAALVILFLAMIQIPVFCEDAERINLYYNNGITYLKEKKYSSSILEFKKVLRSRPFDKTVQNMLATAYASRAQYYKDSEKAYKKAINDYRSAIVYLKYWDDNSDSSRLQTAQALEGTLNNLVKTYAPLKNGDAILNEAKTLRAQGELAASIYEYTQLFNNQTHQKLAYRTASDIYKSLNNEKKALETIREALNSNKQDGMLHFKYAMLLDDIGNEDAAMDEYSKALEYSNNNKELLTGLENLWRARSVQNPKDSQALINLGVILQKQNQLELAKAQYIKARQINPNDPSILRNLASVYTELKDYDSAIRVYDEILLKNKGDLSARLYKGALYEQKGDIGSAIKQYQEILSLKKGDEVAQSALNHLLSNLNGEQLTNYLKQEADKNPTDYDAQFKYAFETHKNKQYASAIEYYKKARDINPKKPEPYINLAQIFMLQNEQQKAENVIAHGLSVLPDNADLKNLQDSLKKQAANELYAKGSEFYNNQNYKEALSYYEKIPYRTPEINTIIANCHYELKNWESAIEYYTKVINENPKDENSYLMIANIYTEQNKEDEAKLYLDKLLSINPNNKNAKNALQNMKERQEGELLNNAISLYENKKYEDSLSVLDKIISINPKSPYVYYYRGVIYEEKGNVDSALAEYKKSISSDPNFSLSYYMAAVALDNKENYKEAVTYYDKYVQLKSKEGVNDEYTQYAKARSKELKDYLNQK